MIQNSVRITFNRRRAKGTTVKGEVDKDRGRQRGRYRKNRSVKGEADQDRGRQGGRYRKNAVVVATAYFRCTFCSKCEDFDFSVE